MSAKKFFILSFLVATILLTVIVGCEGPEGPQGPAGPAPIYIIGYVTSTRYQTDLFLMPLPAQETDNGETAFCSSALKRILKIS